MAIRIDPSSVERLESDLTAFLSLGANPASFFASLLANVPALISVTRLNGDVLFASPHHLALSGVPDFLDQLTHIRNLYPKFVHDRFSGELCRLVKCGELEQWELSVQHKNGRVFLYEMRHVIIHDKQRDEDIVLNIGVDITGARAADDNNIQKHKSQLSYLNYHDPLTGLANRSLFYDRVHKSLSRAKRNKGSIALLLIDLDRFKNINDSLGHESGDYFLKTTAKRLAEVLRDTDTVARLGGDEFVIVLENIAQAQNIETIAQKLLQSVAHPIDIQGHEITCTASIGVSLFPKDGDSIDQLLRHSDLAMSRAKAQGKNRTQFYIKAMTDNAVNYLLLENDLRKAIEADQLCLHFQPQIDLQSGKIAGLEALVRWMHPERGLIPPNDFIPLAEETGLIEPLGEWVLLNACKAFQRWLMKGLNFGKVAVNLSPRQFRQEHLEQNIVKTLLMTRLSPEYLELELTESSAMENAGETIEVLNCMAQMGLSLAIDDFGTGYSSLAYLKRFPINKLKIDRSFIRDIDTDEADASIAKSVIDLAHNMSLQVVAEGVERSSQSRWLIDRGCDQVQGFYYAKPMSEDDLIAMVYDKNRALITSSGVRLLMG